MRIPELPAPITFSAGVTRIRDYLTVAEAVQLADDLLYHVKQHGKRNIAYYQGQTIRLVRDPGDNSAPRAARLRRSPAICYHPGHADCFRPGHGADNPILVPYVHCLFRRTGPLPRLQQTLTELGYAAPTPVQASAIP